MDLFVWLNRFLLIAAFFFATFCLPLVFSYGFTYPSLLLFTSLLLGLLPVGSAIGIMVKCRSALLRTWSGVGLSLALLVSGLTSVALGYVQSRRIDHLINTAGFVRDLNEEYRILTTLSHAVPAGTSRVGFFHGHYYERLSGAYFPKDFLVRQIVLFERDRAIVEENGNYYINPNGPDFSWDPLLLRDFRTVYPDVFYHD